MVFSQGRNELKFLTSENSSMGFLCLCGVAFAKVIAMFAGCIQLWNRDFRVKNKKSAVGVNKLN